jgi:hypothetical protein
MTAGCKLMLITVSLHPCLLFPVCYALFIYLLNLFLAFLQPKFDPSMDADLAEQDVEEGEPGLPTSTSPAFSRKGSSAGLMSGVFGQQNGGGMATQDDEFKPFIRRLPEFKVGNVEIAQYRVELRLTHTLSLMSQFWLGATQAILISLFCTFFSFFDIPVVSAAAARAQLYACLTLLSLSSPSSGQSWSSTGCC